MNTKILGLTLLGAGAVLAAGAGAYLANREVPVAEVALDAGRGASQAVAGAAVTETEGVLATAPEALPGASVPPVQPGPSAGGKSSRPRAATEASRPEVESRPTAAATPRRTESVPAPPATTELPDLTVSEPPIEESLERAPRVEAPPPPPSPEFEDLVVPADAVVGLRVEGDISSETARVEDRVEAVVTRDVRAGGRVAIPAGSRAEGSVVLVERGGKFKERSRIGVRFHTLVLADGTRMAMQSEPVYREGSTPSNESAAKIGGAAIGGAILGAIVGGGRGAAVGGSIGALGGTAAVMAGGRNAAVLAAGSSVTVRLAAPVTVTVEK